MESAWPRVKVKVSVQICKTHDRIRAIRFNVDRNVCYEMVSFHMELFVNVINGVGKLVGNR